MTQRDPNQFFISEMLVLKFFNIYLQMFALANIANFDFCHKKQGNSFLEKNNLKSQSIFHFHYASIGNFLISQTIRKKISKLQIPQIFFFAINGRKKSFLRKGTQNEPQLIFHF